LPHPLAIDPAQAFDKQPKAILGSDYNKKNLIEAEKAYWVIGGKNPGVMTKKAKWAFADKKDAEALGAG
jgi:copper chaperone NosL